MDPLLLMVFLLHFNVANAELTFHISPSQSSSCSEPCLTLPQLKSYPDFDSDTTLIFQPARHYLSSEFVIANVDKLSFTSPTNATIACQSSAKIQLTNISHIHISRIAFVGCSGIVIKLAPQFTIENSRFIGQGNGESALNLHNSSGNISQTQFLSNCKGSFKDSVAFLLNDYAWVGGAIIVTTSDVVIVESTFEGNSAELGGAIYSEQHSNVSILSSTFVGNSASCMNDVRECFGGVLCSDNGSNVIIHNSTFRNNRASGCYSSGGVLSIIDGHISIQGSTFTENNAGGLGGVIKAQQSTLVIDSTDFANNTADFGGILHTSTSVVSVRASNIENSTAYSRGGVMYSDACMVNVSRTRFFLNYAYEEGGVFNLVSSSPAHAVRLNLHECNCTHNSAGYGGVVSIQGNDMQAEVDIRRSNFVNNTAYQEGGIMYATNAKLSISYSEFIRSRAYRHGGVLYANTVSLVIHDCHFINSRAYQTGGVLYVIATTLKTHSTVVVSNNVARLAVVYLLRSTAVFTDDLQVSNNVGAIFVHNSDVTFAGNTRIVNSSSIRLNLAPAFPEGGAITAYQSKVAFNGTCTLMYNQADNGGAIYASESKLYVYSKSVSISKNMAEHNGGGVFLFLSELNCQLKSVLQLFSNSATYKGGGIHATSSLIQAYVSFNGCHSDTHCEDYSGASIYFTENRAELGGGACLEANSKLYVLKRKWSKFSGYSFTFKENSASYGGALYVSDETNSGTCASSSYEEASVITECFIQTTAQNSFAIEGTTINVTNTKFVNNQAHISGSILYGGLLDRCTVSPFAEINNQRDDNKQPFLNHETVTGVDYFTKISDIKELDSVSSDSVRICFCMNGQPKCDQQPPTFQLKKGESFTVQLVAVDQVNHTVPGANIRSALNSTDSGLEEGQLIQKTSSNKDCTDLKFNIYSPHQSEVLILYAEGPCKDAALSQQRIEIDFLPCSCPNGLQPKTMETSSCECECDSRLAQYVSECDSQSEVIVREGTFWINYITITDDLNRSLSGYLIHPHCPLDYCKPSGYRVEINLNLENGSDAQCAHNRTGRLCGTCQRGLSLSVGSSRCISCSSHWPGILAATIIGSMIAGVVLIAILLALNLTVAVGTLNGILFYVNVVVAYSSTFFPSSETNFITVFIAWLNLDVGLDFCFYRGMDAYTKTWLQLAFPAFVIVLVVVVILVSERCTKFARLIGRKNPVATLATLVLLSYAKLLRVIIAALSFAVLDYPDGSRVIVWLPDASVRYLRGKHIALFLIAIFILLLGIAYTALLFFWQWLLQYQDKRVFGWIRNQKVHLFIEPYHAPYTFRHRYWTGLLLSVRVAFDVISAVNSSSDPGINLLAIGTVMILLLLVKSCLQGSRIYRKKPVEILEVICHLNIALLCLARFFTLERYTTNQNVIAYVSGGVTFLLFLIVVAYHTLSECCFITNGFGKLVGLMRAQRCGQHGPENFETLLSLDENSEASNQLECTFSVVDAPPRDQQPLSATLDD